MTAWRKEEEKVVGNRQRKREAEEAEKVVVVPKFTAGKLRRYRAAMVGPFPGPPKHRRLRREETRENPSGHETENTSVRILMSQISVLK